MNLKSVFDDKGILAQKLSFGCKIPQPKLSLRKSTNTEKNNEIVAPRQKISYRDSM